jgi:acetolactate synthase I/II/III large subunit
MEVPSLLISQSPNFERRDESSAGLTLADTKARGADIVVKTLEDEGVELVVGISGHTVFEIADAVSNSAKIHSFHAGLEAGGAFIAEGYNRVKGRSAAVVIGPARGAPMIIGALASSNLDSVPLVAIVGSSSLNHDSKNPLQVMPVSEMASHVVKWSTRVTDGNSLADSLHSAFRVAQSDRPGAVVVEIPYNLAVERHEGGRSLRSAALISGCRAQGDLGAIERAVQLLKTAKRPAILAGGGVTMAEAHQELRELAEFLGVPVSSTANGRGTFPMDHHLAIGGSGVFGWQCANQILDEADVLLAIGCRFAEFGYAQQWSIPARWQLIHIDIDPAEVGKIYPPEVGIIGDARIVLRDLLRSAQETLTAGQFLHTDWQEYVQQLKDDWLLQLSGMVNESAQGIHPGRFFHELREVLPREGRLFVEPTCVGQWALQVFDSYGPKRQFLAGGYGQLGWAIPAALGAKLAEPSRPVVAVSGDWGFQYAVAELGTMLRENVSLVSIVFDEGYQLWSKQTQELSFDGRVVWTNQKNPDFVKLAESLGLKAVRIDAPEDLQPTLRKVLGAGEPCLVSVRIDPSIPSPATGQLCFR